MPAVSTEHEPSGEDSLIRPSISTYNVFRVLWPVPTTGGSAYPATYQYSEGPGYPVMTTVQSPGPNPYTIGAPFVPQSTAPARVRYAKPDSFQLISPGTDNAYGQGGAVPRVGPTGGDPNYYREPRHDDDNLTNFAPGELKNEGSK